MMDWQLYHQWAGGHHLTSVFLHAAATIVLFLALQRMTGMPWPSGWVAAVFAVHPLHVESVAWVAERKDVLSGLFFALTLWLYARYVESPQSWRRYAAVILCDALGLTAKPMLVTLPFVLLLLDYWPLGRFGGLRGGFAEPAAKSRRIPQGLHLPYARLVFEKVPLFVLAAASCVVTLAAQQQAIQSLEQLTVSRRLANAALAYVEYIVKMLYPSGLAPFYPLPNELPPTWEIVGAATVLAAISAIVIAARRQCPYLVVGWIWYLGTMVPVIGLVQVGGQSMADRYTYLPQIGLYLAIVWGVRHLAGARRRPIWALTAVSSLVLAVLAIFAFRQTQYWRDSITLWTHTLDCTTQNANAEYSLGYDLAELGRIDEAIDHYKKALRIHPNYSKAHNNLGLALAGRGKIDEAIEHFQQAIESDSKNAEAHNSLGNALVVRGQIGEAIEQFQNAAQIKPEYFNAVVNLGEALARNRQFNDAVVYLNKALAIRPDSAKAAQSPWQRPS